MPYVDGFVLAVSKDKIDAYKQRTSGLNRVAILHMCLAPASCPFAAASRGRSFPSRRTGRSFKAR
jgi:uncharacterized protein YbaA (DUF1428 family)